MTTTTRTLAAVAAALMLTTVLPAPADAYGGRRGGGHGHRGHWHGHGHVHGHGGWYPGWFWAGIGLGVVGSSIYYSSRPVYPVYVEPAPYVPPPVIYEAPIARAPDPIFYPRLGQSPAQTEADRQDCNRWAMTQQGAMADAGVFHRAALACMEGRGYVVK